MKHLILIMSILLALLSVSSNLPAKTDFITEYANSAQPLHPLQPLSLTLIENYPQAHLYLNTPISYSDFVTTAYHSRKLADFPPQIQYSKNDIMSAALNAGWYDWDEIPPTGELYDKPIPRKIAARILAKAFFPNVKGDYSKWSPMIKDFNNLNGRYYEPVFSIYEAGLEPGDNNGNFNPDKTLTRTEAYTLIAKAYIKAGKQSPLPAAPANPPTNQPTNPTTGSPADQTEKNSKIKSTAKTNNTTDKTKITSPIKAGVSKNGKLQVVGTQLSNEKGNPVVLKGMSSHGIQWYGNFTEEGAVKTTRDYGANVFRVAMYTNEGGYISDNSIKEKVFKAVDTAIALDMYAILDWHILSDGNPNTYKNEAKSFFEEAAKRYAKNPALLYEICNEPNGNVNWNNDIRPYAMEIIPIIRKHSPDAVILTGTGTWSQDIHDAAQNPLPFDNIMYTLHFYAGTHHDFLRERLVDTLNNGIPVFVSEWGTSDATGGGGVYLEETQKWLELLDKHNVSWINWSLCDKNEASAALKPGANPNGGWKQEDLSESGRFVFQHF